MDAADAIANIKERKILLSDALLCAKIPAEGKLAVLPRPLVGLRGKRRQSIRENIPTVIDPRCHGNKNCCFYYKICCVSYKSGRPSGWTVSRILIYNCFLFRLFKFTQLQRKITITESQNEKLS